MLYLLFNAASQGCIFYIAKGRPVEAPFPNWLSKVGY